MKSLSAILAAEPLDVLQSLANWWGAEAPTTDSASARQLLERAMRDAVASRFVWERLDADERRVLFAVAGPSARNWCALDLLADRAKLPVARTTTTLRWLRERRLLFTETAKIQGGDLIGQRVTFYGYALPRNTQAQIEEKPIAYVPTELVTGLHATGRELFVGHADRSDKSMDELLMPYRQGDLDQIGRRFGLSVQAYYSRNEVRAAIAQNLTQAEAVRYALARVEPGLRELYEWLRQEGGRVSLARVRERLRVSEAELCAVVHGLEEYALAFDTFSAGERVLFIPRETLANLRQADDRPPAAVGLREQRVPRAVRPPNPAILWDLAVLVSAAYQQEIEMTRAGSLPKRAAQRLIPLLVGERAHGSGSERAALEYVELLKQEAVDLGLVQAQASTAKTRHRLTPGPNLDSWARHDLVMQARRLVRRWPADRWWIDLPGAHYREWLTFYLELPLARETVQGLLRQCQPGTWYTLRSFLATIEQDDPYVLRPSQRYAGEAGFKLAEDLREHWEHTDGEVLAGMISSTLYELGLIALGYDREAVPAPGEQENPQSFQLTAFGHEVLTSESSASEQPSSRALVVQPNFEVLLMEPHVPALYWLLRFSTLVQVGRVSRFTLTSEALRRGLQYGGTVEEVLDFLGHHSQKALPQNVIYTLRDWARPDEEQTLRAMTLFAVSDEALAGELVTAPKLQAFRLRRVGPREIAVPPEASLRELRRALDRLGYGHKLLNGVEELVTAATQLPARRRAAQANRRLRGAAPAIEGI